MLEKTPETDLQAVHPALRDPQHAYPEIDAALKAYVANARVLYGLDGAEAAQRSAMTENSSDLLNMVHQHQISSSNVRAQNSMYH